MAVSLNALSLRPQGAGVSTYIRELLAALPVEWQRTCTALVQADATGDLPTPVALQTVSPRAGARRAITALRHHPAVGALMHGLDVDLPLRHSGPTVTTVHDLSVFDVPWAFSAMRARGERLLVRRAIRSADQVLAVSAFTADRVRALFGRDSVVTPLAASRDMLPAGAAERDQVRQLYALPELFVLHVGSIEPRKDVPRLAEACRAAGLPLVLAGAGSMVGLVGDVVRLGFVPRSHLPALFGLAAVTAYLSQYEGFGLPPVEALACGGRVVVTPVADLPSLLGDSVVWVRGSGIGPVVAALREAVSSPGPPAPLLTWQTAADRTVACYRSLGAAPAP